MTSITYKDFKEQHNEKVKRSQIKDIQDTIDYIDNYILRYMDSKNISSTIEITIPCTPSSFNRTQFHENIVKYYTILGWNCKIIDDPYSSECNLIFDITKEARG